MNEEQKKKYLERYKQAKQKGVKFFPDIIYNDMIVSFGLFLLLILLATFLGVAREPRVDPDDTSYIPRPEWYFLFLFQFLKYIPGKIEWIGTTIIPIIAILILFLLPFIEKNPYRHWRKRIKGISVMGVIVIGIVVLTVVAVITKPPQEETALAGSISEQIIAGQDLYSVNCVECHGPDGDGGEIIGVEGLEGVVLKPINSQDEMWTRDDETLYNIINFGQADQGMTPFGLAYGGELKRDEINAIVTFMRYTWDERVEVPQEAAAAGSIPTLKENQVPSYEVEISKITKRYCISCHRPGKENNNNIMETYEGIMTSGDHAPNVIPGDLNSNLIRMLHREEIEAGGPMPPTKKLKDEYIDIWERWVLAGAPETAEEAAELTAQGVLSDTNK
ncbi:MAG: c-type cytochrome [Anaerolineales bacterium]|nr:c-type cytochrome [Anaerolineales bacterium]